MHERQYSGNPLQPLMHISPPLVTTRPTSRPPFTDDDQFKEEKAVIIKVSPLCCALPCWVCWREVWALRRAVL